jgi:hypothetical protein
MFYWAAMQAKRRVKKVEWVEQQVQVCAVAAIPSHFLSSARSSVTTLILA